MCAVWACHFSLRAGVWRGEGEGTYPTIATFRYGEEATFSAVGSSKARATLLVLRCCLARP